jgi:radical SAM superfamily enzyme YgiQ (UPF0313 family)
MPKVLFIQPSQYYNNGELVKQKRIYLPGLVFPLLAALTPSHWKVQVIIEVIEEIDYDTDADLIGIGSMGHSMIRAIQIAKKLKERNKTVFMGGYMVSMVPELASEVVDSVIIGDAEISYPKLLDDFEKKGRLEKIYKYPVTDLKGLPVPRYDLLTEKKIGFMLPVQAGRGCTYQCGFCSIACLYKGKYLTRPVDEVVRDIKAIKDLGYKSFYLIDDNIASHPEYLRSLCLKIKPLKMIWGSQCSINLAKHQKLLKLVSDSGCRILSFGLETISQAGLDKLNKNWVKVNQHEKLMSIIRQHGILVSAEMMIGLDSDTTNSIKNTYSFVLENKIPIPRFYVITPVPGTELFYEFKKKGRLIHENFRYYTASQCVHYPQKMSPQDVDLMYKWLNEKVFSWISIFKRTVFNNGILKHPLLYIYAFVVNCKYRHHIRMGEAPVIV